MLTLNREEFLQRLESCQPGLSRKEIVQQSTCFIFDKGTALTYNDEIACRIKSYLPKSFTGAVKADALLKILRKLEEEQIDIKVKEKELMIYGKNKRRWLGVTMEAEIHMPTDKLETPTEWRELHDNFNDAVGSVMQCASTDQSQFKITCVHLHPRFVEATDNIQMARYRIKTRVSEPMLIRQDSIKHVVAMDMTEVAETPKWLHFRNPLGLILSCKRVMEEYPVDLKPILEAEGGKPIVFPKGLAKASERAEVFSSEDSDDNKVIVRMCPQKGLYVRGEGDSGHFNERFSKFKYPGDEELFFRLTPKLLVELATKYNDCKITDKWLKFDNGRFTYLAKLGKNKKKENQE